MKTADYVSEGLRNMVEAEPEGYRTLGKCTSGCHSVTFFIKGTPERVEDIKVRASRRCKKLLAVADLAAEKIKEKGRVYLDEDEVLRFFSEEKEQDKLKDRIGIVKSALGL